VRRFRWIAVGALFVTLALPLGARAAAQQPSAPPAPAVVPPPAASPADSPSTVKGAIGARRDAVTATSESGEESWPKILIPLLAAGLGFLVKWWLELRSVHSAARREFAQKVTSRIAGLANRHYWSLANYAGVLAGLLEDYLQTRAYHLLLIWDPPTRLAGRLDELAQEGANKSFPHFCRLLGLFNAFQFQGSNTYLLTDHTSGEACKRLYNTLVAMLPEKLNLARLYQMEILVGRGRAKVWKTISETPLTEATVNQYLKAELNIWKLWLRNDPGSVLRAAEALRAYNELLNHELALLYKDWFNKSRYGVAGEAEGSDWPNVLTEESLVAIRQSRFESPLLRPLGGAVPMPGVAPSAPEAAQDKKTVDPTRAEEALQKLDRDPKWRRALAKESRSAKESAGRRGAERPSGEASIRRRGVTARERE
jgi:hypothetical protein